MYSLKDSKIALSAADLKIAGSFERQLLAWSWELC